MAEQFWWYLARSGGIVALVASGLAVIWGLLYSTRIMQGRPTPKWLLSTHRSLGTTAVVATGAHLVGLVLDSYVSFGWLEILVPFAAAWNPLAVALGVVAMYLLVAVEGSSMLMHRLPRRWWRRIHLGSYLCFWSAVAHGAMAGTDASNPIYVAVTALLVLAVAALTGYHVLTCRRASRPRSAPPVPVS